MALKESVLSNAVNIPKNVSNNMGRRKRVLQAKAASLTSCLRIVFGARTSIASFSGFKQVLLSP
jgi:hypothetical protein